MKLLEGSNTAGLTGDVVVTTDGMVVTPSGMGFTPMNGPYSAVPEAEDWFATYSAGLGSKHTGGQAMSGVIAAVAAVAQPCVQALEDVASLSPLLTPSNTRLCAAIVDAF